MPIYEYLCKKCNEEFEFLVMGSNDEVECPKCEGGDVERVLSVAAFSVGGNFKSSSTSAECSGCSHTSCSGCSSAS